MAITQSIINTSTMNGGPEHDDMNALLRYIKQVRDRHFHSANLHSLSCLSNDWVSLVVPA
jgi:hypothetical protein